MNNKKQRKLNLVFYIFTRIWAGLSKKRRIQIIFLSLISILSGISEMLTIASLIPFLSVISEPENFWNINYVKKISSYFNIQNANDLLPFVTIIFIVAVIFATIIRLTNLWLNIKLSASIGNDFSRKVFGKVLQKDYLFHINTPSSKTISILTTKIGELVLVINKYLQGLSSIIICFSIFTILIFIEKSIAISILGIFSLIYCTIALVLKNKLREISKIISLSNEKMVNYIQLGLGAIREIILDGNQNLYLSPFAVADYSVRLGYAKNSFYALFPRFLIESIGIILISSIAFFITRNYESGITTITFLGTLALGIQRILPAIQVTYTSWTEINGYSKSLLDIFEVLDSDNNNVNIPQTYSLSAFKNLEFKNVSFRYSKNSKYILKDISFKINAGEKIGIIGTTGSGKSTLIDLIMGLLPPSKGAILVNNKKINSKNLNLLMSWRKYIAHVPQSIFLTNGTIEDNISFGLSKKSYLLSDLKFASKVACIYDFINNLPQKFQSHVGERGVKISGGQLQRIGLARAIFKRKDFIILDEATSSLDEKTEKNVIKNIEEHTLFNTILMISHRLTTIKNCDRVLEIKDASIFEK